jgi:hypothetical protein
LIYERTVTRPVPPAGPTKPITDWSDKFLSQKWPFAKGLPLPDVDSARKIARDQAKQIAEGANLDGRPTMQLSRRRLEELLELAATLGARFTVEHYAVIDARRSTLSARWRRGLFRLWCALSGIWVSLFGALFVAAAMAPIDTYWTVARKSDRMLEVFAYGLGIPIGALLVSVVVIRLSIWVANGFRGGP